VDDTAGTRTGQTRVAEYIVEAVVATIAAAALLVALVGGAANAQEARSVDLDVRKTVSPKTVEVGERQVFTVKVTNNGTTRAERVSMRDPLPSKVRFIRASSSREVPGSCGIEDRVVKCRLGTLRADEMETVKIYVRPVVAGSYTNRAYASFDNSSARASGASEVSDAAKAMVEARSR
jgi:uncharacterized repeat protein (TIGR01451 family)